MLYKYSAARQEKHPAHEAMLKRYAETRSQVKNSVWNRTRDLLTASETVRKLVTTTLLDGRNHCFVIESSKYDLSLHKEFYVKFILFFTFPILTMPKYTSLACIITPQNIFYR
jgi:hypothetical protein